MGTVLCSGKAGIQDIFVHAVVLRKAGYEEIEPGTPLEAIIEDGAKGEHVTSLKPR